MGKFKSALDAKKRELAATTEEERAKAADDGKEAQKDLTEAEKKILSSTATEPTANVKAVAGGKWKVVSTYACPHCGALASVAAGETIPNRCGRCWHEVEAPE